MCPPDLGNKIFNSTEYNGELGGGGAGGWALQYSPLLQF